MATKAMILRTLYEDGEGDVKFTLRYADRSFSTPLATLTDKPERSPFEWYLVDENQLGGLWISEKGVIGFQDNDEIDVIYSIAFDIKKDCDKSFDLKLKHPEYIIMTRSSLDLGFMPETALISGMSIVKQGIRVVCGFDNAADYMQWKLSQ